MIETDTTLIYGHNASPLPATISEWRHSSLLWSSDDWRNFLRMADYEGMQWMPLRWSRLYQEVAHQGATPFDNSLNTGQTLIHSLHQTWRDDTAGSLAGDVIAHPLKQRPVRLGRRLASLALMRQNIDSLNQIDNIQQGLVGQNCPLPVVVFPTIQGGEVTFGKTSFLAENWFQPSAELWDKWRVHSITELEENMAMHGLTGIILDLAILRQSFPAGRHCKKLPDWRELIPQFGRNIKAVQVSLDRSDISRTDPAAASTSCQEGVAFRSRDPGATKKSEQAAMLELALITVRQAAGCDEYRPLPIVVETPHHPDKTHLQIVKNTRQIIEDIPLR